MANLVSHKLTITGPEAELARFRACWREAKGGERYPAWVEAEFDIDFTRPRQLFFSFEKLAQAIPEDADKWVLQRWGFKYVAHGAELEEKDGALVLSFCSCGYGAHYALFGELGELFPTLTMVGYVYEPMMAYGGDVLVAGGKYTFTDKSAEIEAEIEAWAKADAEKRAKAGMLANADDDEIPF